MLDHSVQLDVSPAATADRLSLVGLDWAQIGALVRQAAHLAVAEHLVHAATHVDTDSSNVAMGGRRSER